MKLLTAGAGAVSDSFKKFWDPNLHTGPTLIYGQVLDMPRFGDLHERPATFCIETKRRNEGGWAGGRGRDREERRRENCSQDVKQINT